MCLLLQNESADESKDHWSAVNKQRLNPAPGKKYRQGKKTNQRKACVRGEVQRGSTTAGWIS
ncbi:hypothetical protein EBU99_14360 [bacterium]|nr:hypothetical protein [bacterium]